MLRVGIYSSTIKYVLRHDSFNFQVILVVSSEPFTMPFVHVMGSFCLIKCNFHDLN